MVNAGQSLVSEPVDPLPGGATLLFVQVVLGGRVAKGINCSTEVAEGRWWRVGSLSLSFGKTGHTVRVGFGGGGHG